MATKIIEAFKQQGGKHCITNSLKQIFCYYDYPLSEEMLFGIGEGLDFTYINLTDSPMVSGRAKVMEFEDIIAERLGISIRIKQNKNYETVFEHTKKLIDKGYPVLAYVDMPFLRYFGMNENSHFGGHTVVLFGYDDKAGRFYVSDRDNADYPIRTPRGMMAEDYHLVSYAEMQKARNSNFRPFPANNKYAEFDFAGFTGVNKQNLSASITAVCEKMLNPPANLKGVNGIKKFAREINQWKKFDNAKLKRAGVTNYFQINADGGTGGGIFRAMYGNFLIEAAPILKRVPVQKIGEKFTALSAQWDSVATSMWELHETGNRELLGGMSSAIEALCNQETDLLMKLKEAV